MNDTSREYGACLKRRNSLAAKRKACDGEIARLETALRMLGELIDDFSSRTLVPVRGAGSFLLWEGDRYSSYKKGHYRKAKDKIEAAYLAIVHLRDDTQQALRSRRSEISSLDRDLRNINAKIEHFHEG